MQRRPPDPARVFRALRAFLRTLLWLFFREVEVVGLENVPSYGGGIIVSWHPNGLVDPGLILTQFPRQVVFGARHGLFSWPLLGFMLKAIGTVPIFRASDASRGDPDARRKANQKSLDALAREVARGSFSALFPEGESHDLPHLVELKTGAARLFYRAFELREEGEPPPVILPVGLHYDKKRLFRSRALVRFHPPIPIPPALDGGVPCASEEEIRDKARGLTAEIERVLVEVVHATEDWSIHHALHRGRRLLRAERAHRAGVALDKPGIGEKVTGFQRIRAAYYTRQKSHPEEVVQLRARVEQYDLDLRALGLQDHELDRDPRLASPWLALILILQSVLVLLFFPPLLFLGYLVNGPTALCLIALSRLGAKLKKDEATIKILLGAIAFPATWALVGLLAYLGHSHLHAIYPALPNRPWLAAGVSMLLAAVGGAVALRYLHLLVETARSVRVRLTKRRRRASVGRLRLERAELHDALMVLAEGLELPGTLHPDGSVE